MFENKFYKVAESGGTYVTGEFFNPVTGEEKHELLRDYDYADGSRDNDDLYYEPINEEVRQLWLRYHCVIQVGDMVKVVRGRKVPIGTVAEVVKIYDWKDHYGRTQTTYVVFPDGQKTSIDNVELV